MAACAICGTPGHSCGPADGTGSGVELFKPVGAHGTLKRYTVEPGQIPGYPAGGTIRLRDHYARGYGLLVDTPPAPPVEAPVEADDPTVDTEPVPRGQGVRVGDVISWVDAGPDPLARARRALDAETEVVLGGPLPRVTLVAELERRLDVDSEDPEDEEDTTP